MSTIDVPRTARLVIVTALMVSEARGQATIRLGGEFQVNTYTPGDQTITDVGIASTGDFVLVWESAQDGSATGVFARRYSSSGTALAGEFLVNSYTPGSQGAPAVSREADGDFVVVWESSGQDGSSLGIFARRFNATGTGQATEFRINTYTPGNQFAPAIAADADGDFVVAWNSFAQDGGGTGVFARRFNTSGTPLAAEFQVHTYTIGNQADPAVARDADGDFLVAWDSPHDLSSVGLFARRFASSGAAQATEFQVTTYTNGAQNDAAVDFDGSGGFLIAWGSVQDGDSYGVFARRFNASGAAQAVEFQVNTYTPDVQYLPVVEVRPGGDFVVAWMGQGLDGSNYGVFARRFDSLANPVVAEFQVNTYTTENQYYPAIAMADNGRFVIAWHSTGQDAGGAGQGVFAQRFATPAILDIDANGDAAPLTDGLLVLRYLFGFRGAALVSGAFDVVGCNRCNAPAIEAYLATLI
jgi:hypothetical protein